MIGTLTQARPLTELRDSFAGQDIWVIASGPSMSFIPAGFFDGRPVVGVNEVWRDFPVSVAVRKEHDGAQESLDAGVRLVISHGDMGGDTGPPQLAGDHWTFEHSYNQSDGPIDLDPIGSPDRLVVSWSTITTAIHLAAYMGARAVIVAGHDCGSIDGRLNYTGYPIGTDPAEDAEWYDRWLGGIESQTMQVAERVTAVYGCPVVGLCPWPSLALAGHVHRGRRPSTEPTAAG